MFVSGTSLAGRFHQVLGVDVDGHGDGPGVRTKVGYAHVPYQKLTNGARPHFAIQRR
jgi:hypothetical protein